MKTLFILGKSAAATTTAATAAASASAAAVISNTITIRRHYINKQYFTRAAATLLSLGYYTHDTYMHPISRRKLQWVYFNLMLLL